MEIINKLRISLFPRNWKRFSTYASIAENRVLPSRTKSRTKKLFRNALPMFACFHAVTKLSKYSQLSGRVMTLVLLYSSTVLKAVITQLTSGTNAQNAAKIRRTYLQMVKKILPRLYFPSRTGLLAALIFAPSVSVFLACRYPFAVRQFSALPLPAESMPAEPLPLQMPDRPSGWYGQSCSSIQSK